MKKSKNRALPHFDSLDELVNFFDEHDMGEFYEQMPEADFTVDISRRQYLFALDAEVARKLTEIAKSRKITSEALANAWLIEKIKEQTSSNQQL
jgi:aryl-alcohol dehydrogenase-like predicted oxidoreductase